ncbi:50S ribosomal protein L30 [Legionella israelensis]|uniref:Large ribosomal subunit protein uL30 n=1 Tax=Legionella israelensis TaxID=454 RepID=A0A0W0VIQ4_9GAMM|nr:50S ribosomal protein L30 [Legionella israelensis]KTD20001.1 50S ribosomal protein L30 [Legionella israelensis]QBR85169.1 50S ribosomal protein L30 [Legionella israelensis]QBS09929.1 50S ribosomal protein L30 [Legionella israelensis]QDP71274.1 50S ribosomal protein L30 [Legionella israelensis]SCY40577.1 large subunit ribosomal protein L30 [Legionella israelensis DSM 19235]
MENKIKITLKKSLIGRKPKHKLMAKQLGLGKLNSSVYHRDTPAIRGLINHINYMLLVEESGQ